MALTKNTYCVGVQSTTNDGYDITDRYIESMEEAEAIAKKRWEEFGLPTAIVENITRTDGVTYQGWPRETASP